MSDESELIALKEDLKRSRRRAAFGFVILILALVICMLYAFVQQVAATKNAEEALRQRVLAEEQRQIAEKSEAVAKRSEAIAMEHRVAAEKAVVEARAALERCKGKK